MRLRFGVFELNLNAHELTRAGRRVDIQEQPLRIIALLAQRPGQVVTREEMKHAVWTGDTFVDFEAGLKSALWKARQALGDIAANPRFIETVPRQGYRFIAPVTYEMAGAGADRGPSLTLTQRAAPIEQPRPLETAERGPEIVALRPPARRSHIWKIVLACCAGLLLAAGVFVWSRAYPAPPLIDRPRPFANAHGHQSRPAFSPNGEMLAFDWMGPSDQRTCIYVQRLDAPAPARLTPGASEEIRPVWSNDGGTIAFLRNISASQYAIVTVPLVGNGERLWLRLDKGATPWFDWSADGKRFVYAAPAVPDHPPSVILFTLATGETRVLTVPPAGWRGDSEPTFSPDSSYVAFRRTTAASGNEDIYQVPISGGQPKRITFDNRTISTIAFTPDGGLLFSSARSGTNRSLWWRAPGGGELRRVTAATVDAVTPTVSRDGKHFAFSKVQLDLNIWRINADGSDGAAVLIASDLNDSGPEFSPDGRHILFQSSRTGSSDIWVCDAKGADSVRLTDSRGIPIGAPKWSPDGRLIAFDWRPSGRAEIHLMASDGGNRRALVADSFQNSVPAWSPDSRSIYFSSNRTGIFGASEIWKIPADGGPTAQITYHGGFAPRLSPDGKFIYYFKSPEIWRMPLVDGMPSGAESKVPVRGLAGGDWGNWVPTNAGIYYIERRNNGTATIQYYDFARRSSRSIFDMPKPPAYGGNGLTLSPDGKVLLFVEVDQDDSSIFVQ